MIQIKQNQKRKFLMGLILLKKKNSLNQKKIPDISNLATKSAFTTIENLVKKNRL